MYLLTESIAHERDGESHSSPMDGHSIFAWNLLEERTFRTVTSMNPRL